jgi:protein gp37
VRELLGEAGGRLSENTGISWCDATFNPWWGCTKVSPACDHCYAERDAHRFAPGKTLWGVGAERRTFGDAHWQMPLRWAKTLPAKLGRRPRVFCASMGDWLDLDAPLGEFVRLLDLIRTTPELDWLLLSKRIGNWRKQLDAARMEARCANGIELHRWIANWLDGGAPPNVWLGATVISQAEVDRDVPKLLAIPARVRFVSIEPMLGPIELPTMRCDRGSLTGPGGVGGVSCPDCGGYGDGSGFGCLRLHWVIAGGESGPSARPAHPDWFRALRDRCAAVGVPFHFKQWGEWREPKDGEPFDTSMGRAQTRPAFIVAPSGTVHCFENDTNREGGKVMLRIGKRASGRELDGRTFDGFPA